MKIGAMILGILGGIIAVSAGYMIAGSLLIIGAILAFIGNRQDAHEEVSL